MQSSESRDLASAKHRRDRAKSYVHGVPAMPSKRVVDPTEQDEITNPMVMLERPLEEADSDKVRQLREGTFDPYELVLKLANDLYEIKTERRSHDAAFFSLIDMKPEEFRAMARSYKTARRLIALLLIPALGGLLTGGWSLWSQKDAAAEAKAAAAAETATERTKAQELERRVNRLEKLDDEERKKGQ